MLYGFVVLLTVYHSVPLYMVLSTTPEKALCIDDSGEPSNTRFVNIYVGFLTNTEDSAPFS